MNHQTTNLTPGLYIVATPIGTARDITLRTLDILASASVLAAEDTRSLRRLMDIHGIPLGGRPLLSYHEHNGAQMRPKLLRALSEGQSVAYASEAGMPLIADPGFDLARAARAEGYTVTSAPGPSAVLAALAIGGLPTDAFFFVGFLPNRKTARRKELAALRDVQGTLVIFESAKRLAALFKDAVDVLGPDREAAICRELTKRFENVENGTLAELSQAISNAPPKGEIVVLIDRSRSPNLKEDDIDVKAALAAALQERTVKDAVDLVAGAYDVPRRHIYQLALDLDRDALGPNDA